MIKRLRGKKPKNLSKKTYYGTFPAVEKKEFSKKKHSLRLFGSRRGGKSD